MLLLALLLMPAHVLIGTFAAALVTCCRAALDALDGDDSSDDGNLNDSDSDDDDVDDDIDKDRFIILLWRRRRQVLAQFRLHCSMLLAVLTFALGGACLAAALPFGTAAVLVIATSVANVSGVHACEATGLLGGAPGRRDDRGAGGAGGGSGGASSIGGAQSQEDLAGIALMHMPGDAEDVDA